MSLGDLHKEMIASIPRGRYAKPEDVAAVVAFLTSEDASYMRGQAINVTGGLCMI